MVDHYGAMVDRRAGIEECVACHDGSIAKAAVYCLANCSVFTPHSVMRRYPPMGREAAYRPVESIRAAGLELVDGMVVCVSCHNLSNPPPYHLAVESAASKLCLTCHIQ
ncbi:cytochrome C [bacterium]|nr:cytochrome C [bacterium]